LERLAALIALDAFPRRARATTAGAAAKAALAADIATGATRIWTRVRRTRARECARRPARGATRRVALIPITR